MTEYTSQQIRKMAREAANECAKMHCWKHPTPYSWRILIGENIITLQVEVLANNGMGETKRAWWNVAI